MYLPRGKTSSGYSGAACGAQHACSQNRANGLWQGNTLAQIVAAAVAACLAFIVDRPDRHEIELRRADPRDRQDIGKDIARLLADGRHRPARRARRLADLNELAAIFD